MLKTGARVKRGKRGGTIRLSSMQWEHPTIIKIYEALGAIADGRVEMLGNSAKVFSSSGNKFYGVQYDPSTRSIMANDNASFFRAYLGYPAIAFLMLKGELSYSPEVAAMLKGILWKDLNQQFKNDFGKTLVHIMESKSAQVGEEIQREVARIDQELRTKVYYHLGKKSQPPVGY